MVAFYAADDDLAELAGEYLLGALTAGGAAIVLATPEHRLSVEARLSRAGTDLAAARADGRYVAIDAAQALERFLLNGWPDPASFWAALRPVIQRSSHAGQPVRVFAEMVRLLWDGELTSAAIELEALWNELAGQYRFTLLCGHHATQAASPDHSDELAQLCGAHSVVLGPRPDGCARPLC